MQHIIFLIFVNFDLISKFKLGIRLQAQLLPRKPEGKQSIYLSFVDFFNVADVSNDQLFRLKVTFIKTTPGTNQTKTATTAHIRVFAQFGCKIMKNSAQFGHLWNFTLNKRYMLKQSGSNFTQLLRLG